MKLSKSSALITGASRGLGLALATQLAEAGAQVVLVARHAEPLQKAVEALQAKGLSAHGIAADVGDPEAALRIAHEAAALIGPIDLLVHNASTLGPVPLRPLLDIEAKDFDRVLQVNLLGPFRLSRIIAGSMALRSGGLVLSISSDAATNAYPGWGPYGVSKAALDHLSRTFAQELKSAGVRFVCLDPGEMDTRMHAQAIPDADRSALRHPQDVAQQILALIEQPQRLDRAPRQEVPDVASAKAS